MAISTTAAVGGAATYAGCCFRWPLPPTVGGAPSLARRRLTLIAGEEKFPPSPVVWALTSHGSLLAWTALHKKAPPVRQNEAGLPPSLPIPPLLTTRGLSRAWQDKASNAYPFMTSAETLPPAVAAPSLPLAPGPNASPGFASATAPAEAAAASPPSKPAAKAPSPKASEDLQNAAEMGDHDALLKALAEGADVDSLDAKQLAPLHWAAKCGRPADITALIAAGAKIDIANKGGVTPLIYAASEGWDDCVPLLLAAGADPSLATA